MARKKRRFEQLEAAAAAPKEKPTYVDPFQQQVIPKIEGFGKRFEGKGRTILYVIAALVVLSIVGYVISRSFRSSSGAAQAALGDAIETSQAQISPAGVTVTSAGKSFKSEQERANAAIAEFQAVADKFGGSVGDKARYFVAVNRLVVDRPAGIQELESIAGGSSETAKLAKFALAQTRADDGRIDEAISLYKELAAMDDSVIAKDALNLEAGKLYEKQGKKQEAADIFFNIAKAASETKDLDGKAVPLSQTASEARDRLKELDPERAKQIVEPPAENPFDGG